MNLNLNLLLFFLFVVLSFSALGQVNVLNAERPEEIGVLSENQEEILSNKKYLEYPHVNEGDVMWSKIVYEEIDLSEKFNHPLYFPKDGLYKSERKSMWRTIKDAILDGRVDKIYNDANPNFSELFDKETYIKRLENREGPEVVPLKSMDIV